MEQFTGYQYLLIDIANAWGLDKKLYRERIQWTEENIEKLEQLAEERGQWKERPLYVKAVMTLRKVQQGLPTGHLVGFDGVCSGVQIMSVVTGCEIGAKATGLIDPDRRPDAYTDVTLAMNEVLGSQGVNIDREDAKKATMTAFYGSKEQPKSIFGEGSRELECFYRSIQKVAPGAWNLLQVLLESWQPYALFHAWKLPDGFDARVKVMQTIECRIEVDELDHSTFTYVYKDNVGSEKGISLPANVVHSLDAYVLRSVHRRCNYNREVVERAHAILQSSHAARSYGISSVELKDEKLAYYVGLWQGSGIADVVILPYITEENVVQLPSKLVAKLLEITMGMLTHEPFEVVTIHDEFKCGLNHMNRLRQVYVDILVDLAESTVLNFILSAIHGEPCTYQKRSPNLGEKIRNANYALC